MTRSARRGISLIEVLVVVAILGVLIGMMMPATRRVREAAARTKCTNNLKQLMLAFHSAHDNSGRPAPYPSTADPNSPAEHSFPPGCLGPGTTPEERLSWMVALLPYLEHDPLYKQFDREKGYAGNLPAARTPVGLYLCPEGQVMTTADGIPVTHYVALAGLGHDAATRPAGAAGNGFMGYDRLTSATMITDGLSNTIGLAETRSDLGPWPRGGPSNVRGFDPAGTPPFGGHGTGMNAAMADGSVRFIRSSVDPGQLAAGITIAGRERVNLE